MYITALNRSIPVVVAVYRFYLVYYPTKFYNIQNKKTLQAFLIFYAIGTFNFLWDVRFSNCMGREEQIFFNINDFHEEHNYVILVKKWFCRKIFLIKGLQHLDFKWHIFINGPFFELISVQLSIKSFISKFFPRLVSVAAWTAL